MTASSRSRAVTGSSALYYDFDSFQEMAVTTGGADAQNPTPGVSVNMVLKKGLNTPHGDVPLLLLRERHARRPSTFRRALADALGNTTGKGNRTDKYLDYGFDLGGPLLKDSAVGVGHDGAGPTIDLADADAATPDDTHFKNYAFKLDGKRQRQGSAATSPSTRTTRSGTAAAPARRVRRRRRGTRPGPTSYYKGEGNFVFGSRALRLGEGGIHPTAGSTSTPVGGLITDYYFDDSGCRAQLVFTSTKSTRPQHYVGGDANYFAGKQRVEVRRLVALDAGRYAADLARQPSGRDLERLSEHAGRRSRATTSPSPTAQYLDAFVTRHDLARPADADRRRPLRSPDIVARRGFGARRRRLRDVLPALSAPAINDVFDWNNLTPRVGSRWRSTSRARRIVRASYAMFASQLPGAEAAFVSPIQYSYAYYNAVDRNGDGVAQLSEILFSQGLQGYTGFDPNNPTRSRSNTRGDPNVKAPITHELLAGFDRELTPRFGVERHVTYRRMEDLLWTPLDGRHLRRTTRRPARCPARCGGDRRLQRAAVRA